MVNFLLYIFYHNFKNLIYPLRVITFRKEKKVLIYSITQMNLENILLGKKSHLQKTTYCRTPFTSHMPFNDEYIPRNASFSDFVVVNITVYLHKPRTQSLLHRYAVWYSLLLLGYKPVWPVTVSDTVDNCNTMVFVHLNICKCRRNTTKNRQYK